MALHLKTTFSEDTVLDTLDAMIAVLDPEMERNSENWGPDYETWKKNVEQIRTITTGNSKLAPRRTTVLRELKSVLALTEEDMDKYFGDIDY